MRVHALLGHGAKAVKYFAFGPEWSFPGSWSRGRCRRLLQTPLIMIANFIRALFIQNTMRGV